MSTLIVDINQIKQILPHDHADSLERVIIKGWQVVVRKGSFKPGDLCVYIPPDAVVTEEMGNRLGIWKYTSKGRIKAVRLRGEPSFGCCIPISEFPDLRPTQETALGMNIAELLGITKWVEPISCRGGDVETEHPAFHKYTDIENFGNFPNLIQDDEEVVCTEKIHGCNSRIGFVDGQWMAGSHNLRRKEPADWSKDLYWFPLSIPNVKETIERIYKERNAKSVIIFGEIYGKVQKLRYGMGDRLAFRAFDISVDGKYVDFITFQYYTEGFLGSDKVINFGIATVPIIKEGLYGDLKKEFDVLSSGKTTLLDQGCNPINHIREGIVIKPIIERQDPKLGRVILKYKSADYIAGNFE